MRTQTHKHTHNYTYIETYLYQRTQACVHTHTYTRTQAFMHTYSRVLLTPTCARALKHTRAYKTKNESTDTTHNAHTQIHSYANTRP